MSDVHKLSVIVNTLLESLQSLRLVRPEDKNEIETVKNKLNQVLSLFQDESWLQKAGKVSIEFDRIAGAIENLKYQLDSSTAIQRLEGEIRSLSNELQLQKSTLNSIASKIEENNDSENIARMFKEITQALEFLKKKKGFWPFS